MKPRSNCANRLRQKAVGACPERSKGWRGRSACVLRSCAFVMFLVTACQMGQVVQDIQFWRHSVLQCIGFLSCVIQC